MSLMLRKEGQIILDQHKIPNFHVGIDPHNTMNIQSECGKPFLTIQGIRFNHQTPTAPEVTYAIELLDGYMATHIQTIKAYLKAEQIFSKKKLPPVDKRFLIDIDLNAYNSNTGKYQDTVQKLTYTDKVLTIYYVIKNKKVNIDIRPKSANTPPTKMTTYKEDKKLNKEALAYLKAHYKYMEEEYNLEQLKQQLSVCNI